MQRSRRGQVDRLVEVMRDGRRTAPAEPVNLLRDRCIAGLARLPQRYRQITRAAKYPGQLTARRCKFRLKRSASASAALR